VTGTHRGMCAKYCCDHVTSLPIAFHIFRCGRVSALSASTAVLSLQRPPSWPFELLLRTQSLHACVPQDYLPPAWHTDFPPRRSQRLDDQEQHKPVPLPTQLEPYAASNLPPPAERISTRGEVALCASSHRSLYSPPALTLITTL